MLHPTNIPDCAPELECLLDFQERLLDFACRMNGFARSDLDAEFGVDIASWLHENRFKLLDPIKAFSENISSEEKQKLLVHFRHDRTFNNFINDSSFSFQFVVTEHSSDYVKNLKQLFIGYYEQLKSSGFHPQICGHATDGFTGRHWWSGYRNANPDRLTCAVCDASLSAGGKTIEHFFPKKQYPVLSTHPSNLIPLCKTCNNDVKKEKDPLASDPITAIYLPYYRSVRPEIKLEFSNNSDGGYAVKIEPATDEPSSQKRISNFETLFDLSNRWSKELDDISVTAISRARDYIDAMRDNGKEVNAETIPTYIDIACTRMERNWGKNNYEYVATEWLRWAKNNKPSLVLTLVS